MIDLSKLSDEELTAYATKNAEEAMEAEARRAELEFRFRKAEIRLMALTFGAHVAGPNREDILGWTRWAYKEAIGEEW